jgi:hypothetical protein
LEVFLSQLACDSLHSEAVYFALIGVNYLEFEPIKDDCFIAPRHMAKRLNDQATDGVKLFLTEIGAEINIKFIDGRQCFNEIITLDNLMDEVVCFAVGLILNFSYNLLQNVLNGY